MEVSRGNSIYEQVGIQSCGSSRSCCISVMMQRLHGFGTNRYGIQQERETCRYGKEHIWRLLGKEMHIGILCIESYPLNYDTST